MIIGGGVIVYPTETVYGLGANALDEQAIMRVFRIKKRPLSMPIFLAVSSLEMLERVAEMDDEDRDILEQIFPGPVSVLVRKKSIVPDILTAGSPLVGIRFPDHETGSGDHRSAGPHHLHQRQPHRLAATRQVQPMSLERSRIGGHGRGWRKMQIRPALHTAGSAEKGDNSAGSGPG